MYYVEECGRELSYFNSPDDLVNAVLVLNSRKFSYNTINNIKAFLNVVCDLSYTNEVL